MKISIFAAAVAALILPVLAAPAEMDSRGVSRANLFLEQLQHSAVSSAVGRDLVKRASALTTYLDRLSLPDGCNYGISGRESGASVAWMKKQITELKKNPDKVAKTLGGYANSAVLLETGSLQSGNSYSQVAYSWETASRPAIKHRDIAAALQKMVDSCGTYSPKGAISARYWLKTAPGAPSIFAGGSHNWIGNDGWCLAKRDEIPLLQARASKSILPGQCYTGETTLAHIDDVKKCIKQLDGKSQTVMLPRNDKDDLLSDRSWFACSFTAKDGGYFRARALINSTCKHKITSKQVSASLKRLLNTCGKAKKNYVGGTEYLDGDDQVFVDVYSIPK